MRILALIIGLALILPASASAALLSAEVAPGADGARVVVMLEATTTPVNAVEGTLVLPHGAMASKLYIGGSVIGSWVEAPRVEGGRIRFAGIIPGGFTGSAVPGAGLTGPAALFSFELSGPASPLFLADSAAYLNDGEGTRVAYEDGTLTERLLAGGASQAEDRTPPEFVDAAQVEDARVADGRPALLLSSYDAESGLDYFEVQEGRGPWKRAADAYAIEDAYGFSPLSVRAYDRAGNFLEIRVPGRNEGWLHLGYALAAAIAALLALSLGLYFKKRSRRA